MNGGWFWLLEVCRLVKLDGRLFVECVRDGKGEVKRGARCMCQEEPNSESVAGSLRCLESF
jgi:hypothetical protein